jgi:hypothetical protein
VRKKRRLLETRQPSFTNARQFRISTLVDERRLDAEQAFAGAPEARRRTRMIAL